MSRTLGDSRMPTVNLCGPDRTILCDGGHEFPQAPQSRLIPTIALLWLRQQEKKGGTRYEHFVSSTHWNLKPESLRRRINQYNMDFRTACRCTRESASLIEMIPIGNGEHEYRLATGVEVNCTEVEARRVACLDDPGGNSTLALMLKVVDFHATRFSEEYASYAAGVAAQLIANRTKPKDALAILSKVKLAGEKSDKMLQFALNALHARKLEPYDREQAAHRADEVLALMDQYGVADPVVRKRCEALAVTARAPYSAKNIALPDVEFIPDPYILRLRHLTLAREGNPKKSEVATDAIRDAAKTARFNAMIAMYLSVRDEQMMSLEDSCWLLSRLLYLQWRPSEGKRQATQADYYRTYGLDWLRVCKILNGNQPDPRDLILEARWHSEFQPTQPRQARLRLEDALKAARRELALATGEQERRKMQDIEHTALALLNRSPL